jgi:hypothetical protein
MLSSWLEEIGGWMETWFNGWADRCLDVDEWVKFQHLLSETKRIEPWSVSCATFHGVNELSYHAWLRLPTWCLQTGAEKTCTHLPREQGGGCSTAGQRRDRQRCGRGLLRVCTLWLHGDLHVTYWSLWPALLLPAEYKHIPLPQSSCSGSGVPE